MRLITLTALFLTFLVSLASSLEDQKVEILVWPFSAPKPQSLAKISYNSTGALLRSYAPPNIALSSSQKDEILRIGFYSPDDSTKWSGILTSASNFDARREKRLQLLLDADGRVYHVGFKAVDTMLSAKSGRKEDSEDAGFSVEVVRMRNGPTPRLNKPVVPRADGNGDGQEPEKSFFQKYWWAIAGVLLIQVLMAGGKQE